MDWSFNYEIVFNMFVRRMNKFISRFSGRQKTNKRQKSTEADYNLISTGQIEEVDVPGLGRFPIVEDDKPHATEDITFSDAPTFKFKHRGCLASVIHYYKFISIHCPRVKYLIEKAGWEKLLNIECNVTQHAVVDYIVERFWDTTNTFHFPFGEMGFTPLDWVMLTGLSIGDGYVVPYDSSLYQFDYVREKIFPDITQGTRGASWISNSITITYLSSYFKEDKLVAANEDSLLAHRIAIAFFMYVLGQFFFPNAKNYIDAGWLAAFEEIDKIQDLDWGGSAFSRLYAGLRQACRKQQKALSGPFQILEVFW